MKKGKNKPPVTPAIRMLRDSQVTYTDHPYHYEPGGGTALFARVTNINEHLVIKTLIMEDEAAQPLIILMHGDQKVSTKELARQIGRKSVMACDPITAERHSGYKIGGTSPFGTRKKIPVFCEEEILKLPQIFINGGARGYIIGMDPRDLAKLLKPIPVRVAR
ncbi:MAG: Cys-tRNA(Pro) deacylase [Gammaproteobacteria bacterium]|nr:Cys-tRNA(Pro) deacylase [Gammaproteobacteria bacterium]